MTLSLNFNPFPELTSERLHLRRIMETDIDEIFILRSDPLIYKYLCRQPSTMKDEAMAFIHKILEHEKEQEAIMWGITAKENLVVIGTICLWRISPDNHRAEIGYVMNPANQGKGYMREAISEVLNYGFRVMKLHSVVGQVNPENIASVKLLDQHDFIREGYFKENIFYEGKYSDTAVYTLLSPINNLES